MSLEYLSRNLINSIISKLQIVDIYNLCLTNNFLFSSCDDDSIWEKKFMTDFYYVLTENSNNYMVEYTRYKDKYKNYYKHGLKMDKSYTIYDLLPLFQHQLKEGYVTHDQNYDTYSFIRDIRKKFSDFNEDMVFEILYNNIKFIHFSLKEDVFYDDKKMMYGNLLILSTPETRSFFFKKDKTPISFSPNL